MKTIRSFVEGKVRRSETGEVLSIDVAGDAHPELGALEAKLASDVGAIAFHEKGMVLSDGAAVPYAAIARVEVSPPFVEVVLEDGAVRRLRSSPAGALVVHATLRWIGATILRRKVAE